MKLYERSTAGFAKVRKLDADQQMPRDEAELHLDTLDQPQLNSLHLKSIFFFQRYFTLCSQT